MANNTGKSFFASVLMFLAYFKFLPIVIIPIIAFYSCQIIHSNQIKQEENNNPSIIASSDVTIRVFGIVRDVYNKDAVSRIYADKEEYRILYVFRDGQKSAAEYESMVKDEITSLYNALKDKTFKDSTIWNNKANGYLKLFFYVPDKNGTSSSLCSVSVEYKYDGTVTEENYKELMSKGYVTSKTLEDARKGDSYPLEEYADKKGLPKYP